MRVWLTVGTLLVAGCATSAPTITHQKSGATTTLEGLRGHVVVVNFWAEWCKPCMAEVPVMAQIVEEEGNGVLFLPVYYREQPARTGTFYPWLEAQPAYFRDRVCWGNAAFLHGYDLHLIPQTYVLGRDGALVEHFQGGITGPRPEQLRAAIRRGLGAPASGEVPPAAPSSR